MTFSRKPGTPAATGRGKDDFDPAKNALPDVSAIKQTLKGRWAEVFSTLGGCPSEYLDGKGHPCPKCGQGTDRFSFPVKWQDEGGLLCRHCFNHDNGDGIAALQWLTGKSFPEVVRDLESFIGSGNGHVKNSLQTENVKNFSQNVKHCLTNGNAKKPAKTYGTPEEVITAVYCSLGKRSGDWHYENAGRELVGIICRWDTPTGKTYRPVSKIDGRWVAAGMPEPWPLYHLPELPPAPRVYVFEGEKAADAARSIGLTATTSPHGSKSAGKADWTPLAGKEIILLPDNDKPGKAYGETVNAILAKLTPAPVVKIIELPGLPEAGDIVEWIENHGDAAEPESMREEIESLVAEAAAAPVAAATVETFPVAYHALTCAELDAGNYALEYLIDGILVAGQPCIMAGGQKTLKTSLLVDLFISLATGGHFLGRFPVNHPIRVGLMSGESGLGTLQETARRIAQAAGRNLAEIEGLLWSEDLPRFGEPLHEAATQRFIESNGLGVIGFDPAYLMMPGCKPEDMFAQGGLLRGMSEVCRKAGCMMILAHHTRKNRPDVNAPVELSEIAWAGFSEFARQWLLVGRRQPYEPGSGLHRLWLSAGGSAGHNGLWALDVAEGTRATPGGRFWEVKAEEARQQAEGIKEAQRVTRQGKQVETDRRQVVDCMVKISEPQTKTKIRERVGLGNGQRFDRAWASLLQDGIIKPAGEIRLGNGQQHEAYRLREGE